MIEVLKLALEALQDLLDQTETPPDENCSCHIAPPCSDCVDYSGIRYAIKQASDTITSLRQAIREHAMYEVQRLGQEIEQELVAWMKPDVLCDRACMYLCTKGFTQFPECAITHPPQRKPLTDERVNQLLDGFDSRIETAHMNNDLYDVGYLTSMRGMFVELCAAHGIKE